MQILKYILAFIVLLLALVFIGKSAFDFYVLNNLPGGITGEVLAESIGRITGQLLLGIGLILGFKKLIKKPAKTE